MGFTFTTSAREVLEQVVREPRFRALTTIPLLAPMQIGLVLGAFALFALSSYAWLNGALPWWGMTLLNAFAVYASFTPLHDATHRTVSCNRRLNDAIGTLSCLLLLPGITTGIYRFLHLEHHRYAGDAVRDPDEPFVSAPVWQLPLVLAFLDVLWVSWYLRRWGERPAGERVEFVAAVSFYVAVHVVGLASPWALEFVLLWVIPQRLGLAGVSWFFAHIQHPRDVSWEEAPFQTTVRIVAMPWTRWLLLGQSKHHIHHLAPSVPWYRYHRAWDLGRHLFERQHIPTRTLWAPSQDLRLPGREAAGELAARVASVRDVASDVRAYELVPAGAANWPHFEAGAHIDVQVGEGTVRQYSLCNSPATPNRYVIAVRLDRDGRGGSVAMHADVNAGDAVTIGTPRNNFPLDESLDDYVLVAGGIGVTPLLAMAHRLHALGKPFVLHLCARSEAALPFHAELAALPFADRLSVHLDTHDEAQRFDPLRALGPWSPGRGAYLCGPSGFMQWVTAASREAGWPVGAVQTESFVPARGARADDAPFEVQLARSGRVLQVGADESLLDVLNANGCAVICSCTQGICGSCMTPVLEGVPDHRDAILTDTERAANAQMTVCVSRARSARLVLDL